MTTIVHIIDELKVGGAQTHLVTMLRHLSQTYPFKHCVIGLFGDGPVANLLGNLGIEIVILDLRPLLAQRRFGAAVLELKSHIEQIQPDLVEAHLTWSRLLGLAAARIAGVPTRIGFEQGDIYLNSLKFRLTNCLSQFYTDRYIVCSDALRQWVRCTHHIRDNKIAVFHNCVDSARFYPEVEPASDVIQLKHNKTTLYLMVGTLGNGVNKRVDVGIRALSTARQQGADISLAIAGDGEQRSSLENLAVQLDIADYVHFLGMRNDIPAVVAASDVFCHAAPFEPFGIVALEAMAVGRPVIVPDSGGIREAVDSGVTGLIYPALDVEALARAMSQLNRDGERRKEMGIAARRTVETRFTVEQYVERLYTLYGLIN